MRGWHSSNTRVCNWSVCPCTHTEEYYVYTDGHTFYLQYHMTRTTSLANPIVQTTPPGTPSLATLHGILTNLRTRPYSTLHIRLQLHLQSCYLCCHHNHCRHFTAASRTCTLLHQVFNASAVIVIPSSVLAVVSNLI